MRFRRLAVPLLALALAAAGCRPDGGSGGARGGSAAGGSSAAVSAADLALHHAPVFYQDVNEADGASGISDLPLRFDYDGDCAGADNSDEFSLVTGWQQARAFGPGGTNPAGFDLRAHVYGSVVETDRNYFITYAVFHARDWSDAAILLGLDEHENDLEGALVVIEKDGTPYGRFLCLETVAHGHFLLYTNEPSIAARGREPLRGGVLFTGSHPRCYVEAEGHGVASGTSASARLSVFTTVAGIYVGSGGQATDFRDGTGFILDPAGPAQFAFDPALGLDPADPSRRTVGYDILPLDDLWARRASADAMAAFGPIATTRFQGSIIGWSFAATSSTAAHPPWGWSGPDLQRGDLFLDPAWAVSEQFDFSAYPGGFDPRVDGTYLSNPYIAGAAFLGTP